jgi:hypothetical protein
MTTPNKRLREARRRDLQREKADKKRLRKEKAAEKSREPGTEGDEDPDIAGIVAGPQPPLDEVPGS